METKRSDSLQSLDRALLILLSMEDGKEMGASEISRQFHISKSTAHTMMKTLEKRGFVQQDEVSKKYAIGASVFRLGLAYFNKIELRTVAEPFAKRLSEKWNASVNLAVYSGGLAAYILRVDPPEPFAVLQRVGLSIPAHVSAGGKVLLASLQDKEIEKYALESLKPYTKDTITTPDRLWKEVNRIRQDGYGLENGESLPGMGCAAAPIRDGAGNVTAAISVSGASEYVLGPNLPEIIMDVKSSAVDISKVIGFL